jgi:hypothetical protein
LPGLAAGLSWDQSDPAHLKLVATTSWKNCSKRIRTVKGEIRVVDMLGGVSQTVGLGPYTADTVHKASGKEKYAKTQFVSRTGMSWDYYLQDSDSSAGGYFTLYQSCTQAITGARGPASLSGWSFYIAATAYDRSGNKVAELFTPKVPCGTNG